MQLTRRALLSSVPLRRGSNPCVLTLYRELIGTAVLLAAARWIDKSLTVAKPQLRQCALSGALFALIRLSVVFALNDGGADLTAALVPLVPVMTLGLSLLLRMERLRGAHDIRRCAHRGHGPLRFVRLADGRRERAAGIWKADGGVTCPLEASIRRAVDAGQHVAQRVRAGP